MVGGKSFGDQMDEDVTMLSGIASMSAYFTSKYSYDSCLESYMKSMRLLAEKRHENYMQQLLHGGFPVEAREEPVTTET